MASLNDTVIKGKLIADDLGTLIREVVLTEAVSTVEFTNLDGLHDGDVYDLFIDGQSVTGWNYVKMNCVDLSQIIVSNWGTTYTECVNGCIGALANYGSGLHMTIQGGAGYGVVHYHSFDYNQDNHHSVHGNGISIIVGSISSFSVFIANDKFAPGTIFRLFKRR